MRRRRLADGVFADRYGFAVIWRERGRPREKRFPADTPLKALKVYRATQASQARAIVESEGTGSFPRDVVRFLRRRKGMPCWKAERSHLRAWVHRFRHLSRWTVTRDQIAETLDLWRQAGYSPQTLTHRLRLLRQLYHTLDGPGPTPCDGVTLARPARPRPVSVSDRLVRDVALQLQKQEVLHRLHSAKTRARYLVLATTGQRPAQLRRAHPLDVDLERRVWFVRPAKGDQGSIVYLNDDMTAAWQLFIAAKAWGHYDGRSFAKTLQRNGWPKGVRPYQLRHTVGLTLSERDVDLGDIQAHMGHSSPTMTRVYVPGVLSRLKVASEKLDGRLGRDAAGLPRGTTTLPRPPEATHGKNRPDSEGRPRARSRAHPNQKRTKSA